jgi:hypothetical protein
VFEEGAEQDEQEDVGGRNQRRDAEEALGAEGQLVDDLVEAVAAVFQHARQVLPEQAVGRKMRQTIGSASPSLRVRLEDISTTKCRADVRSAVVGSPERWIRSASNIQW